MSLMSIKVPSNLGNKQFRSSLSTVKMATNLPGSNRNEIENAALHGDMQCNLYVFVSYCPMHVYSLLFQEYSLTEGCPDLTVQAAATWHFQNTKQG